MKLIQRLGFGIMLWSLAGCGILHKGAATANNGNNAAALPAAGDAVKNTDRWKVKADETSFYRYGPQQLGGKDFDLKKDVRITMIRRGRGFSQIRTVDNQTGFVGTEDITPLSADEIAAEDAQRLAASAPPGALTGPMPIAPGGGYTIPPEAGRAEGLPLHDASPTPTPPPATIFRY